MIALIVVDLLRWFLEVGSEGKLSQVSVLIGHTHKLIRHFEEKIFPSLKFKRCTRQILYLELINTLFGNRTSIMKKIFYFSFLLLLFGCHNQHDAEHSADEASHTSNHGHHHGHANKHMNKRSFEELVAHFESAERIEWQKPDSVITFLGDLRDQVVMVFGCGTGYFSFRLAEAGAQVICADVDERFLNYIDERKAEKGLTEVQMETRKIPYDSPALAEGEVDIVLIVNTYHHIEDRINYFAAVRRGLKPEGRVVVVDFQKEKTPVGPPVEMKIKAEEVSKELRAGGFTDIAVNNSLLPYQYIVTAR